MASLTGAELSLLAAEVSRLKIAIAAATQQLEAVIQEKDAVIRVKDAAIQEKDAVLQAMEALSIFQYFKHDGRRLPQLRQDGTTTGPTPNTKHEKIESFQEKVFGMLDIKNEDLKDMKLVQATIPFDPVRGYLTEIDVQLLCSQFLKDMTKASKLSQILDLRCLAELKADFWVVSYNGLPVGAIEVKKPGKGDRERDYGQLFDYILRIRSFHGIQSVFGICTTFAERTNEQTSCV